MQLRSLCAGALALALLAGVSPAQAQETEAPTRESLLARAQVLLTTAGRAYAKKDYEGALAALREAEPLAEQAGDPELAKIRYNIARCYEQLGRSEEALTAYERYDRLPDATHRKQKAFAAMQALEQEVFGQAVVACAPSGATVEIQGLTDGPAVCPWQTTRVRPGRYAVEVRALGHLPREAELVVEAGATATLNVELEPDAAATPLAVAEPVPAAEVRPLPWILMGSGAVVAGVGGVFHALASEASTDVETLPPGAEQDDAFSAFERDRILAYSLYGVGAATAITGLVLQLVGGGDAGPVALQTGLDGFTVRF